MKNVTLLATLFLAGISSFATAQVTKAGNGYLLRVKYSKGQSIQYSSTTSIAGMVAEAGKSTVYKVVMPIKMKIDTVVKGIASSTVTVGPATMSGSVIQQVRTLKMQLNTLNKAANSTTAPTFLAALPPKTVKVGAKWSASAPMETMPGQQSGRLNAVYTFEGVKTVDKKSVAMISYTISGSAAGKGMILVLASDGTLYRNSAKVKLSGPTGAITANTVLSRIK